MSLSNTSHCWRIPDELWANVQPLLPPSKPHPLGCHRPRVDDRKAMDDIFYHSRTGCQWKALDATGTCSIWLVPGLRTALLAYWDRF